MPAIVRDRREPGGSFAETGSLASGPLRGIERNEHVDLMAACIRIAAQQAMIGPAASPARNGAPLSASVLEAQKATSHDCRHAGDGRLLRNSIDTARKIRAASSSMNAV